MRSPAERICPHSCKPVMTVRRERLTASSENRIAIENKTHRVHGTPSESIESPEKPKRSKTVVLTRWKCGRHFSADSSANLSCRGRDADYSTPPAQIRTSALTHTALTEDARRQAKSCSLPHTAQSLGHAFPALCRVHVRVNDVLLSLRPSLPNLRGK